MKRRFLELGQLMVATAAALQRVIERRRHAAQFPELAQKTPIPASGRVLEVELERDRLRPAVRDV